MNSFHAVRMLETWTSFSRYFFLGWLLFCLCSSSALPICRMPTSTYSVMRTYSYIINFSKWCSANKAWKPNEKSDIRMKIEWRNEKTVEKQEFPSFHPKIGASQQKKSQLLSTLQIYCYEANNRFYCHAFGKRCWGIFIASCMEHHWWQNVNKDKYSNRGKKRQNVITMNPNKWNAALQTGSGGKSFSSMSIQKCQFRFYKVIEFTDRYYEFSHFVDLFHRHTACPVWSALGDAMKSVHRHSFPW